MIYHCNFPQILSGSHGIQKIKTEYCLENVWFSQNSPKKSSKKNPPNTCISEEESSQRPLFFLMIFYFKDHFLFTDVWKQDIGHNDLFTVKMRGLFLCVYLLILCVSSSAKARCPCCSCVLGENSWLKINHLNTEQNFWIKIWSGSLLKSFGIWHLVYFIIYVTSEILSFIP